MSQASTFKLYLKPDLPTAAQDSRHREPATYIGHVIIGTTTYGIVAHAAGEGRLEGQVIDWQELVRRHVAGEHAEPAPVNEQLPF